MTGNQFKPGAYRAFVGKGSIKKQLKPKQRQPEQMLLLLQAYLSFVDSFFRGVTVFLNFVQSIALIFIYARKK
jgi:hypothetical protein